ncbi:MAG: hypothetical protein E2590_12720 [Chryseobacterium sp.]|nr:hypothetical protein [Chryseobacterium sp.]
MKPVILGFSCGEPLYGGSNPRERESVVIIDDIDTEETIQPDKLAKYLSELAPFLSSYVIDELIRVQEDIPEVVEVLQAEKKSRLEVYRTNYEQWIKVYHPDLLKFSHDMLLDRGHKMKASDLKDLIKVSAVSGETLLTMSERLSKAMSDFRTEINFDQIKENIDNAGKALTQFCKSAKEVKYKTNNSVNPADRQYKRNRR